MLILNKRKGLLDLTNLTYKNFVQELRDEVLYHAKGNSEYRKLTSLLSLEVALKTYNVNVFLDKEKTVRLVNKHLDSWDEHRKKDVAKMLNMIARSFFVKQNLQNEEVQKHINEVLGKKLTTV